MLLLEFSKSSAKKFLKSYYKIYPGLRLAHDLHV